MVTSLCEEFVLILFPVLFPRLYVQSTCTPTSDTTVIQGMSELFLLRAA